MKNDKDVIKLLKEQARKEKEYQKPFVEARRIVKEREKARETAYQKFKRHQTDQYKAEEKLREILSKK